MDGDAQDFGPNGLYSLLNKIDDFVAHAEVMHLPRGKRMIKQGSQSEALYFVKTGRVTVVRDGVELAEIGPGEAVGEIAFFTGAERTADVVAARDSLVLKLSRADYDRLCGAHPDIPHAIARDLARRLDDTSAKVRAESRPPLARTIAIIPAGVRPLDQSFAGNLVAALSTLQPARAVTLADAPAGIDLASAEATEWFNGMEDEGDTLLFVSDPDNTDWSERILRQADQVLIVGHAGAVPGLSLLEAQAFETHDESHRRLVLIHPEKSHELTGTAPWLDSRPVFMHHHVAEDGEGIDALARFLAGRAVGFVGGGGGALGAFHPGIYEALRRRGKTFDIFGGTSVGAAMTAAFAKGLDGDEIDHRTGEIFVKGKALAKITVPRYSLLDHAHFDHHLRLHYGEGLIEDLWHPYFAVATDLSDNSQKVIRRGPVWAAIRASAAIPGALTPYFDGTGSMLADGGSVDNMPYRVMHRLKSGPNVVVGFNRAQKQAFDVDYAGLPGRHAMLRRLVLPFVGRKLPRAPGPVSVVMRTLLAGQRNDGSGPGPEDWVIRPELPKGTGFMDWKVHSKLYQLGIKEVEHRLAQEGADIPAHFRVEA